MVTHSAQLLHYTPDPKAGMGRCYPIKDEDNFTVGAVGTEAEAIVICTNHNESIKEKWLDKFQTHQVCQ